VARYESKLVHSKSAYLSGECVVLLSVISMVHVVDRGEVLARVDCEKEVTALAS
jgi:hypothetical protein